jgi:hypothetical protein
MTPRRTKVMRGALFASLAVGVCCFSTSFLLFTLLGIRFGFTSLHLFERQPYFRTEQEVLWSGALWFASCCFSIFSFWFCFRFLSKFFPPRRISS